MPPQLPTHSNGQKGENETLLIVFLTCVHVPAQCTHLITFTNNAIDDSHRTSYNDSIELAVFTSHPLYMKEDVRFTGLIKMVCLHKYTSRLAHNCEKGFIPPLHKSSLFPALPLVL